MATREEKLKKINLELDKLDDEQLEAVSGGFWIKDWRQKPIPEKTEEEKKIEKYMKIATEYEKTRGKK